MALKDKRQRGREPAPQQSPAGYRCSGMRMPAEPHDISCMIALSMPRDGEGLGYHVKRSKVVFICASSGPGVRQISREPGSWISPLRDGSHDLHATATAQPSNHKHRWRIEKLRVAPGWLTAGLPRFCMRGSHWPDAPTAPMLRTDALAPRLSNIILGRSRLTAAATSKKRGALGLAE
ncbi:hypothetical protein OPT61_g8807 [Boeremia exigua]|uniref:Uncharacterized protein n=1 Tax=Boeremia exigua TaxID=749465 RepID=A0ACC2HXD1_9PLEO|nr:hypothetical protein OPT61_g8807 [Boeremia exigua]